MKIVRLNGGLGNQMFQYAFAKELQIRTNDEVCLFGNKKDIFDIFDIDLNVVDKDTVQKIGDINESLFGKVKRHYFRKASHELEREFSYKPKVFDRNGDVYYDGYWQSEKYFSSFNRNIDDIFKYKKNIDKKNSALIGRDREICSIHVRRGDYLTISGYEVCDAEYYRRAINIVRRLNPDVSFLCFSNDIDWCRKNILIDEIEFVDWNVGENSWQDMWLMSQCKYNIIANSTFSWWGAYLGKADAVVAPRIWMNRKSDYYRYSFPDIIPDDWIKN